MDKKKQKKSKAAQKKRRKELLIKGLVLFQLVLFTVYFLFPFVWMLSVSLQTETEIMTSVGFLNQLIPDSWRWENYLDVFRTIPFARYFLNSGIVTGLTVIGTLLSSLFLCSFTSFLLFFTHISSSLLSKSITSYSSMSTSKLSCCFSRVNRPPLSSSKQRHYLDKLDILCTLFPSIGLVFIALCTIMV